MSFVCIATEWDVFSMHGHIWAVSVLSKLFNLLLCIKSMLSVGFVEWRRSRLSYLNCESYVRRHFSIAP